MAFDPSKLRFGQSGLWIYHYRMIKWRRDDDAKRWHDAYITPGLKDEIEALRDQSLSPNLRFYDVRINADSNYDNVYNHMRAFGAEYRIAGCRPHRLRHTFAVFKLTGVNPATLGAVACMDIFDVSVALGHASVTQTQKTYAAWTSARARGHEDRFAATLPRAGLALIENPGMHSLGNLHGNA
jgi:integrase